MNDSNFKFGSEFSAEFSSVEFSSELVKALLTTTPEFSVFPDSAVKVQTQQGESLVTVLDLTPFEAKPQAVSAQPFFENLESADDLIAAYKTARASCNFEVDLPSVAEKTSAYSNVFIDEILQSAKKLTDMQIKHISNFVKNLDVYCAIKSIESLLNSQADIALLEVAHARNWHVHFDHLAIRCGSEKNNDAVFIAHLLMDKHGYVSSQVKAEAHYQFPDGWNAFPLYKILENGQVLRLFIDQSDVTDKNQIIQHWNRVYGYTAHHLALRATKITDGEKREIPLNEVMHALQAHGVTIMTPTGEHTHGCLLQVFTKPELNESIPAEILDELRNKSGNLEKTIKNGKLLEVVSRKEMPQAMAIHLFALYGLKYNANNPIHSAPYYTYFLPAQAAHVIKTSQTISK